MRKKKSLLFLISIGLVIILAVIYSYNYKIIKGDYNQLTITKMNEQTHVIHDLNEIRNIINKINNSSREFQVPINKGFKYDYLPHGLLTFENETEKKVLGIVYLQKSQVSILTDYWEIKTDFSFSH
ncbi:hypothetical protein E3U55_03375 [Filobacillus milosensis]|uniref:Uncharacterized protein n=1 Tax=Filobacillus milosensis TaxID=94137 RepID=A0A4Y8IUI7_9BACI|nr:hypothetical protein [Filobacillus milosensis]TFB23869.1 hypothetical protein E3U55_03375 [Filobacillus milosensis]